MKSTSHRYLLVAVLCALMFAYGCFLGAIQTVIESVAGSMSMDTAGMGALVSLQFVPVAFVPVLMGSVADRIGRKRVIAAFCALFGIGLLICSAAKSPWVYALGILMVGAGYSVCESGCCAAMSDLGPDWGTRGINLSQALLCLGAVITPMLVRKSGVDWRTALRLCAACYGALLPMILLVPFPPPSAAESQDRGAVGTLLKSTAFLCLFAAIFLYVGLETGFGYFIESLIFHRFGQTALSGVSLYWLGMMVSRFVFSSIRYRSKPVLTGSFFLSAALFLLLTVQNRAAFSLALCFLTGFAFGPIWSTLVARATALYPSHAGTASGLMSAGCGAGGILFPAVSGMIAQHFSLGSAFGMMGGVAILGGVLCALLPGDKT
ncbi:MAG: MFS transporter [Clostridia bacterium]|nr:MFS transporter [Clostridia bacterium]